MVFAKVIATTNNGTLQRHKGHGSLLPQIMILCKDTKVMVRSFDSNADFFDIRVVPIA